jgi:uncharacterized membrane protein required for colicin V production
MAIILDILVLGIIGISVFLSWKKGMIKTLFSLVGGIAAIVLAVSMSAPVAKWVNEEFVSPTLKRTVLTAINGSDVGKEYDEALAAVDVVDKLQEMPPKLRSFLEKLDVDVEALMSSADQTKEDSVAAKEKLVNSIVDPISETASKAIALVGLFIVFFVALFVATALLDKVFAVLPFAKTINKSGGVIFGLIRAFLLVFILGAVAYGLASGNLLLSAEELEKTLLLKWVNAVNPILLILK